MTRPTAGQFGGPLARVRYTSTMCGASRHADCTGGPGRPRYELPCSCPCHDQAMAAAHAYLSTMCHLAGNPDHPDAEHGRCPALTGQLWAEIPGRRDHLAVPCTCACHTEETP